MRILFTTTAGMGHFHPLVPLAQAAERAGHTVAFACPVSFCERVAQSGFQAFAMLDLDAIAAERAALMRRVAEAPPGPAANAIMLGDGYVATYARHALPELVALCRRWRPDVVVREEGEFAAAIAAEHLGLPHAAVQIGFGSAAAFPPLVGQRLDELRAAWALPPDPGMAMLTRYLCVSFDPPALLEPAPRRCYANTHHLRATVFDRSGAETLPAWFAARPDRPIIYVTLGSEAPGMPWIFPRIYRTLLEGVRAEDATIIMTLGRNRDPAELGPQPANVHVERYVPQSLVLPHCAAVVTHGGHNTVLAAMSCGVPLLLTPLFADQFDNARRCVELEVGQALVGAALTAEAVRSGVRAVLREPRFRANARRLQAEMDALPGLEHGVELLEQIARVPAAGALHA